MNQLFGGSLCLSELIDHAKSGHSAFSKAQNGKVYVNILTWLNDSEDKFGNCMSHQLSSSKEMRDKEGKIYIGNSKHLDTSKPVSANDIDADLSNVSERPQKESLVQGDASDDLPF